MSQEADWISPYIEACCRAYGLALWRIDWVFVTAFEDDDTLCRVKMLYRGYHAVIQVRADIKADEQGYISLNHEMAHIALSQLEQAKDRIIELAPIELRDHAEEIWQDADEQTTERLARAQAASMGRVM